MKKKITKKNIFLLVFASNIIFFVSAFQKEIGFCGNTYNDCWDIVDLIWPLFMISLPLTFLSLLTYRMRDEAFRAWWNPARLWIPVIIAATLVTSWIDSQSGSNIGDFLISPFVLGTLYFLFVASSLWNVFRAYRQTKGK